LPREVKEEIIHLHLSQGRTFDSFAAEYNVSRSAGTRWVKEFREECQNDPTAKGELEKDEEIRQLRKRVTESEKELAIAKSRRILCDGNNLSKYEFIKHHHNTFTQNAVSKKSSLPRHHRQEERG